MCRKRERDFNRFYIYISLYIYHYIYTQCVCIYIYISLCVSVCVYALWHFIKVGGKKATRSVMICASHGPPFSARAGGPPVPELQVVLSGGQKRNGLDLRDLLRRLPSLDRSSNRRIPRFMVLIWVWINTY